MMSEPPRSVSVVSVVALNDLHLQLDFDDGLSRTVDVTPYIQGPEYKQVRLSEKFFRTAHVENGTVVWDNGVMIDADLLRYGPPKPPKPPKAEKVKAPAKPAKAVKSAKAAAKPVAKVVKAKAKPPKAKAKPAAKPAAKKTVKSVKPVKKAKPAAKPMKAKTVAKPAKKAVKKKK